MFKTCVELLINKNNIRLKIRVCSFVLFHLMGLYTKTKKNGLYLPLCVLDRLAVYRSAGIPSSCMISVMVLKVLYWTAP